MSEPLCGDPTCECPGCQPEALEEWFAQQERDARAIVRAVLAAHDREAG